MSRRSPNRLLILGFVALGTLVTATADADIVHLKNGRTLRATHTEVQGDKLVFIQNGMRAEIPMALVDRIEEDAALPPAPLEGEAVAPEPTVGEGREAAAAEQAAAESAEEEGAEAAGVPPEQTREFWQAAVLAIEQERRELEASLVELRREERAFLFSHRSTAPTRERIEAVNERMRELDVAMDELRREARRLQIPPGWLRVTLPRDGY